MTLTLAFTYGLLTGILTAVPMVALYAWLTRPRVKREQYMCNNIDPFSNN